MLVLPGLCLLTGLAVSARAGQLNPEGDILTLNPTIYLANTPTVAKLKVENTGVAAYFFAEIATLPTGWTGSPTRTQPILITRDDTHKFEFTLKGPNASTELRTITFRLYGCEFDDCVNFAVQVDQANFDIRTELVPAGFQLLTPEIGAVDLTQPISFVWLYTNADTYKFELFEDDAGFPAANPIYSKDGIIENSLSLDTGKIALAKLTPYHWNVTAFNAIGQVSSTNGPLYFTTVGAPPLGEFTFQIPSADNQPLSQTPSFSWTASQNAEEYRFEVFTDDAGTPHEPAVVDVTTAATAYSWQGAPLATGPYHVLVTARNETNERLVNGGVRPFRASALSAFSLAAPASDAQGVSQTPLLQWNTCTGATQYRAELYREVMVGSTPALEFQAMHLVPAPATSYQWPEALRRNAAYQWRVAALAQGEERENDGGLRRFTTVLLGPFAVVEPAPAQTGIETVPIFHWIASANAARYIVEMAPSLGGQPDLTDISISESIPAPQTQWRSYFEELTAGADYFWRVTAFTSGDGQSLLNSEGWVPFTVLDMPEFDLLTPAAGLSNVTTMPTLTWESAGPAQYYIVHRTLAGLGSLPPIQTLGATPSLQLTGDLHLNGETAYTWTVEAVNPTGSRFARDPFQFITAPRNAADSGDVLDMLLGHQLLSASERASIDIAADAFDSAVYRRAWCLESGPCH
ncbi:hypothetical protein HZA57_04415 [Candidatus Poribacteria bacterium]|nr:hypothetical protein [Candidatus Poribacteria bacterium]